MAGFGLLHLEIVIWGKEEELYKKLSYSVNSIECGTSLEALTQNEAQRP